MRMHGKNSHASATLAWDGTRLLAVFINSNALWLTAVSIEGQILWQQEAGPFRSEHGYGSSPALFQSLVIVSGDNAGSSFLAALDRETRKVVWRTSRERPGGHGNYSTPVVLEVAGKPQLLLHGHGKLTSYDPSTGELIWSCAGPSEVAACTVACSDDVVFASGGYPEKEILAVQADGRGDVSESHVIWRAAKGVTYVPSPIYHDGHLFLVNDQGIASCFAADTGKLVWQQRLKGDFSSSPVLADGKMFASNESGTTFVFDASPEFNLVAENRLGEGYFATPAFSGGQIFLRTTNQLCCIGEFRE
jgi:outer membrane protein assembly factor BamB